MTTGPEDNEFLKQLTVQHLKEQQQAAIDEEEKLQHQAEVFAKQIVLELENSPVIRKIAGLL